MRSVLRKLPTYFLVLSLQQGCSSHPDMDGRQDVPVEAALAPAPLPSTPAPPSIGIQPATGWGWSPTGEPPCTRRNDGTVTWHGGTWTVPLPAKPGDSIADVNFTIEAPTGNAGDPQVVVVELFSSASPAALTQTQLQPEGMGNWVNSNAGLTSPHVVVSGETLELVFVPLNGAAYAANDMKIDAVSKVPGGVPVESVYNIALAQPGNKAGSTSSLTILGGNAVVLWFGTSLIEDYLPLSLPVGSTLTGWKVWLRKETSHGTMVLQLRDSDATTENTTLIGSAQSTSASNPGSVTLGQSGLSVIAQDGHSYYIASHGGGTSGTADGNEFALAYAVWAIPPP